MENTDKVIKYDTDIHALQNDLRLRQRYPYLKTKLYKVDPPVYHVIYCENYRGDFNELQNIFEREIRRFTIPTKLVDKEPVDYIKIVETITEKELWNMSGFPFTKNDLYKMLQEKFPDIDVLTIGNINKTREIEVAVASDTDNSKKKRLKLFLNSLDDSVVWILLLVPPDNNLLERRFFRKTDHLSMIVDRDTTFFYDNKKQIYSGNFNKNKFSLLNNDKFNCFVDYTYSNSINLRYALLLYDVVYMKPPLKQSLKDFLKTQFLSEKDFYFLLNSGHIVVILPDNFNDSMSWYNDINDYPINAFLSDKMIASLILSDIIEISQNYLLNDDRLIASFMQNLDQISSVSDISSERLQGIILWPQKALINTPLFHYEDSFKSIANFGINTVIQEDVSKKVKKDIQLEFMMFSQNVHIASALEATYFPFRTEDGFSDSFYANIMSAYLNFFKCFSSNYFKNYIDIESQKRNSVFQIDLLNFFELNTYDDVCSLEGVFSSINIKEKGRAFMKELSLLKQNERIERIETLNEKVLKELEREKRSKRVLDLIGILPKDPVISLLLKVIDIMDKNRKYQAVDYILNIIEEILESKKNDAKNIHYLMKINRVAKIRSGLTN